MQGIPIIVPGPSSNDWIYPFLDPLSLETNQPFMIKRKGKRLEKKLNILKLRNLFSESKSTEKYLIGKAIL